MKILRPFTGTGAIFFPIGIPPVGTCENATKNCLKNCYQLNPRYPDYDEEILISQNEKQLIYKFIIESDIETIFNKFKSELNGLQTPILHWFGSGDCLMKDLEKISLIIERIKKDENIIQMGFTRNVSLWNRFKDIFALTIEKREDATESGMYSIPDYKNEQSVMFSPFYQVRGGLCGPISCDDMINSKLSHYINCKTCMRLKTGCYDRRQLKNKEYEYTK